MALVIILSKGNLYILIPGLLNWSNHTWSIKIEIVQKIYDTSQVDLARKLDALCYAYVSKIGNGDGRYFRYHYVL